MNIAIRSRLLIGFLLMAGLVVASGLAGYVGLNPAITGSERYLFLSRDKDMAVRVVMSMRDAYEALLGFDHSEGDAARLAALTHRLDGGGRMIDRFGGEATTQGLVQAMAEQRTVLAEYRNAANRLARIDRDRREMDQRERSLAHALGEHYGDVSALVRGEDAHRRLAASQTAFSSARKEVAGLAADGAALRTTVALLDTARAQAAVIAAGNPAAESIVAGLEAYGALARAMAAAHTARRTLLGALEGRHQAATRAMQAVIVGLRADLADLDAQMLESYGRTAVTVGGAVLAGLAAALLIASLFYRSIIRPVGALERIVNRGRTVAVVWGCGEAPSVRMVSEGIRQFGYLREEIESGEVPFIDIVHENDRERLLGLLRDCPTDGEQELEYRIRTRGGGLRWVEDRLRVVRNERGEVEGYQGVLLDVTARRKAEAELFALNEHLEGIVAARTGELARKALDLEQANKRLMELDELKSAFINSVSHELRTPLTSVRGFAKLIGRDFMKYFRPRQGEDAHMVRMGERIRENLSVIEHESDRLTRLINDVLDISKIESGRMNWNDRPTDLGAVIERAATSMGGETLRNPELTLSVDLPDDLPLFDLDPDKLSQVLINLLSNALKFTKRGEIRVSASFLEDRKVAVSVSDTGVGIPEDQHLVIFDTFRQVRGDTLSDKPKGTGLGLAICRQIVEHYGGGIAVRSAPGEGSTFTFWLPVKRDLTIEGVQADAAGGDDVVFGQEGSPLVLVVDDDRPVAMFLARLLEQQGLRSAMAFDGDTALRKARALRPALVTMDIMMPVLDGKSAINVLRNDPELYDIPVLVVTALTNPEHAGGDAALIKPFDEDAFLDAVHSLLKERYNKSPILALELTKEERDRALFVPFQRRVIHCDEPEFWQRIEAGYQGTVVLPARAEAELDLAPLLANRRIQVLIMPEYAGG